MRFVVERIREVVGGENGGPVAADSLHPILSLSIPGRERETTKPARGLDKDTSTLYVLDNDA